MIVTAYSPPRGARTPRGWLHPSRYRDGTWIEPAATSWPYGGPYRRVRARCPDGRTRIGRAALDDWGLLSMLPATMKVRGVWVAGHVHCVFGFPLYFEPAADRKNGAIFGGKPDAHDG